MTPIFIGRTIVAVENLNYNLRRAIIGCRDKTVVENLMGSQICRHADAAKELVSGDIKAVLGAVVVFGCTLRMALMCPTPGAATHILQVEYCKIRHHLVNRQLSPAFELFILTEIINIQQW